MCVNVPKPTPQAAEPQHKIIQHIPTTIAEREQKTDVMQIQQPEATFLEIIQSIAILNNSQKI